MFNKWLEENKSQLSQLIDFVGKVATNDYVYVGNRKPEVSAVKLGIDTKPQGGCVWYAMGTEWPHYMMHNSPEWPCRYIYRIIPNLSQMYVIDSKEKLDQFDVNFGGRNIKYSRDSRLIDWNKASQFFSGLDMTKWYQKTRNFPQEADHWRDHWDIPSGAIWNGSALSGIQLLGSWTGTEYEL